MIAVTQRVRLQAISLAIVLAIIDQTHGFTLRYEYVRPLDLTGEESSPIEVKYELKRDIDDNGEYHVAPIGIALPLIMTTEATDTAINNQEGITKKETLSDWLEPTAIPNNINTEHPEDIMGSSSNNHEVKTSHFQVLKLVDNITSTSRTEEETTTVITTLSVTENNVETLANEVTNASKHIEYKISQKNYNATTESTNVGGTITELPIATDVITELTNISVETTPPWKKYTKIERKPVHMSEDTVLPLKNERIGDSLNAHTTESRVSLEKAFDLAPDILSLQELKSHLITTNSIPTTELLKVAAPQVTEGNMKSLEIITREESKTPKINSTEMVSKRAGYLDHTKTLINAVMTTTVNTSAAGNEVEAAVSFVPNTAYDTDAHDENEDTRNMTSHSQMVEDAMKEELLKEAQLVDSLHYTTSKTDNLIVRPINYDKKNNLYTVSPNYKPLKKIEVQPSKPFMRDPDDNSWRNESLSSLGIVFKGKNSSKAFTEVLKNKTETVMNNSPETERVLEKVELRDRLEKIAERRKSRKKTDKFGNTEYGDYEENSSGDMHSSKEKPSGGSDISLTTSTLSSVTKERTTPAVTESYKTTKLSKSKSRLNDYYDGKDDYVDYATFPNIDILKSTPRPRVQWPVTQKMSQNTQPMRPYFPDRQPTVQYFPPLPKAVTPNANKYNDNDFKQRFIFYGHTAHEPIETDEYSERNRGTSPTEKYVTKDRSRGQIENKTPAIQHVEYRPVGETDDGSFSIRHYKDLLESVIKDTVYDRNGPYQPTPVIPDEGKAVKSEEYDYGQRKEGLNRFVDYFNQNHERFKADFPVLFNTSIVHGSESGKVLASSSAMFKRLYNGAQTGQKESFSFSNKPFDPNCENITVELSPAYELHYYVPEQEETGDHTLPYGYRP